MKKQQTDPNETVNLCQKAEDVLRQHNIGLEKLTRFYMESSKLSDGNDLEKFICIQIKDITGAEVSVFSGYDYASCSTRVIHIEMEPGLLKKMVRLLGKELKKMSFVVNEEIYKAMTTTSIAEIRTLHEVSFGTISPPVSAAIQALVNVNRFIALSFILDGKLYGTTLLAMNSSKPDPPREILEQFINMAALALQRKLTENALRESEERFKALHNASFGGIAIHDQGVILDCNQGLTDMTGYSREELMGMNGYLLIAPESRQLVLDNISAKYEKPYEAMGLRKNGETFPMRLEARNIPYKGKSVRTVEFRDLTEQKLAEKKLRKSEKDLIEAQRIARLGSWYLDIATNQVEWSEELYKIYGYDPSLPPPPYTEHHKLFTDESWQILKTALANTADNGVPYELELNTVLPDGTKGWLWVFGQTVKDENGVVIGISGAAQEITERKKAEYEKEILTNQLNHAQKMDLLGQLAGGVAHDFNNLLTVIMGYSAELSNSSRLDNTDRHEAEEIYKAGARAKRLTQQLLTFSRKQVVQAIVLDLNELITNLQVVFDRLIGAHIKIVFQASTDPAMVKVDRVQIEQTIINLVLNSRDAMPLGGTVTIKTFIMEQTKSDIESLFQVNPGKYVLLSVADTGCGIPQEIQNSIFEPFFTTKEKGKGLGLGLSNVSNIVKSSGGSINFESSPKTGTTFNILLPYTFEQIIFDVIDLFEKDLNGNGEQILIVDDEETLTDYFQKKLTRIGYNVAVANSGAEALMLLEKGLRPDLVISDIIMPRMNGKELIDKILQETPDQKVLFMSGFTDDIIHPLGVSGSIPFIQKPCSLSELAITIKNLLSSNNVAHAKNGTLIPEGVNSIVKILMLDDDADLLHLIQRTCRRNGYEFFGAQNLTDALTELEKSPYDVLLIDDNLGIITGAEALSEIRAKGHKIPAIGISGALNADRVDTMEDAGMIDVIEKSSDFISMIDAALCAAKIHH